MRFKQTLQKLEDALDIPYPERRELLDEVGGHLEDIYQDVLAGGATSERAHQEAVRAMVFDDEFLSSINVIHRTAVANALARLPAKVSLGIEYVTTSLTGVLILGSVIFMEASMLQFILDGGFFMVPLNLAGLAIIVLGIERFYSLFIKKDHGRPNLDRRLRSIRFLGLLTLLTGVIGTLVGIQQAFTPEVVARFGGDLPVFDVVRIALNTTVWGLLLTFVAEVAHFVIKSKVERIHKLQLG